MIKDGYRVIFLRFMKSYMIKYNVLNLYIDE